MELSDLTLTTDMPLIFLGNTEIAKGAIPAPAPGQNWSTVIEAPVGRHSQKPERSLKMIEAYYPNLPKIELNWRGPARPGWSAWGLEVEKAE